MFAGQSFAMTAVIGGFAENSETSGVRCTQRTSGPCTIDECTESSSDAGTPSQDAGMGEGQARSAGVITISGAGQMIQLTPDANNSYRPVFEMRELFPAGTTVTVSAAGSAMGVPAFSGTLTMPAQVTVTSPMLSMNMSERTMISRTQPLATTWTGGTSGKVVVELRASAGARNVRVSCMFDAASGRGTVPADVMMALPAGEGSITIAAADSRDQMAGDYKVTLMAANLGLTGVGGTVNFQ
jgi:hypothetical protein